MNDNLELNCKGTFPSWGYKEYIGGVQWEINTICHGCKYLQSCITKKSWEVLIGGSLSQESFEFIGRLSQIQEE